MSTQPLFLDNVHKLSFTKLAMPVKLSDSPDSWQREVASELFKQLPFLGDYSVNVIMDRVDAEHGYAFGSAIVTNKSQAPEAEQKELPSLRIPIIVKERMMMPLDVFMDGKGVFPLSPARVRERLFRTETFETTTRKPSDRGLVDQLYPPMRTNYGLGSSGGVGVGGDGMGKMAGLAGAILDPYKSSRETVKSQPYLLPHSKKYLQEHGKLEKDSGMDAESGRQRMIASMHADGAKFTKMGGGLIVEIAPTIPEVEADEFVDSITNDEALKVAAAANPGFQKLAFIIAGAERVSLEKTAEALVGSIRPTVVQLTKLASGNFRFKYANAEAFAPQEGEVPPEAAAQMAGSDKVVEMQPGGTVTVSTNKAQKTSLTEDKVEQIKDFGIWKVQNMDSNERLVGHVLPLMDFDMEPLEMFLFTDGGSYAVQDEMAGTRVGHDLDFPFADKPEGTGVFVHVDENSARALLPMTIQNAAQGPDGTVQYHGETMFGEPVVLTPTPGLQAISPMGDMAYGIPDSLRWLPLIDPPIYLAKQPLDIEQVAGAQAAPGSVDIGSTGKGEFSMEGQPLKKVAKAQKQFLKTAEAEFLLVGMGMTQFSAREALSQAEKTGHTKVAGLNHIVPLSDLHKGMVKKAADLLSQFPYELRRNLVKEASVLDDTDTADKVLAMNFINPENVGIFASYLPDLDKASCKLAEMLLATRLGLKQIDEGAVERSMKNMEVVIEGLKALQQRELI
jgi:hypothetical protein